MRRQGRWLQIFLVLLVVLGSGAWVFNPSQEPGRGIMWDRYQTQKTQEREAAVARQNYCPTSGLCHPPGQRSAQTCPGGPGRHHDRDHHLHHPDPG